MSEVSIQNPTIAAEDAADIAELNRRIGDFRLGREDEERFKLYRLTRGVYGQRQQGVHMFRLKIPGGRITTDQIKAVADISDQFASSNLHLTTRQNIQLHHVKLEDSPKVWTQLAMAGLTAREACGNTVRNITASPTAGIDPNEAFDVWPYVKASFEYFLRNPICQEMGRKIKPAFSSSTADSAYVYFSDFGFIPVIKDGVRGFTVCIGGGLGALAMAAKPVFEFLPTDEIIPFMEACLRVFDRYGEREKRQKARLKFLIKKIGLESFLAFVAQEKAALVQKVVPIDDKQEHVFLPMHLSSVDIPSDEKMAFERWKRTNVFRQKQNGYYGVYLKVPLGDISSNTARTLADVIKRHAADDVRITISQNLLLRYVQAEALASLYMGLKELDLHHSGAHSIADITACPGTDTCNLGVTNSTALALALEAHVERNYAALLEERDISIKISGCMNACGQHMASPIGLHGSSIKKDGKVIPAMQIVLGGGIDKNQIGHMGDKVIKLPTKRILQALDLLLKDYDENAKATDDYITYAKRLGKRYFYDILKPLAHISKDDDHLAIDWGQDQLYRQEIGVGECAGVVLDLVGTILKDAQDKLQLASETFNKSEYSKSVYYAYSTYVVAAKAILLSKDVACNTHIKILEDFQQHIIDTDEIQFAGSFVEHVLQMKMYQPNEVFAKDYLAGSRKFLKEVLDYHNLEPGKIVLESHYKA